MGWPRFQNGRIVANFDRIVRRTRGMKLIIRHSKLPVRVTRGQTTHDDPPPEGRPLCRCFYQDRGSDRLTARRYFGLIRVGALDALGGGAAQERSMLAVEAPSCRVDLRIVSERVPARHFLERSLHLPRA